MSRTFAQDNATDLIRNLVQRAKSMGGLKHKLTQGELKELHVAEFLKRFLTSQFDVGTGTVVNREGKESRQTDIIIYDNRIIPPVVENQGTGIFPVESVIATVSIRTTLNGTGVKEAEDAAAYLAENVVGDYARDFPPLYAAFGFAGGIRGLSNQEAGKAWLDERVRRLFNICIAGRYCWANVGTKGWTLGTDSSGRHNETKRFLALLLDNTRSRAEARYQHFLAQRHWDWFSRYIRD
jgi:hypothetical protein